MRVASFRFQAADGASIFARKWTPGGDVSAIVQIAHGLAEHSARYERLAEAFTDAGYAVYANDHRGHGETAPAGDLGFFAEENGWEKCVGDLWALNRYAAAEYPNAPIVFFGHSMGSFLGQAFLAEHSADVAGAILSASNGAPPAIATLGRLIARIERWRLGPRAKSALLQTMMFGAFNKKFAPNRTAFDWLSRDTAEVDAYIADPLCGFDFSIQ